MDGHLDYELDVNSGPVTRGQQLGMVLARTDGRAPSHLHFEVRTFLTTPEVNGAAPRYGVSCGYNCPPGPGYWPIDAPEHPSEMGWRNPAHVIGGRMFGDAGPPKCTEVVVATGAPGTLLLWSDASASSQLGELALSPGDRYPLLGVDAGPEDATETSAAAYHLWFQIDAPDLGPAWVQAALPDTNDTMADGRPASIRFTLLPNVATA
jgi:murein DD-endopeptidase MepM/ murein hydrolase activator NlpD